MIDYTRLVANDWTSSAYYDSVESEAARELFWGRDSQFYRMFSKLNLEDVIEIACGHGRHYQHYMDRAGTVVLIDVNQENIDYCAQRFANLTKKPALDRNGGCDIPGVSDECISSVFCYDAMVHFELADVTSYLSEIYRVLKPGGRTLLHHSNFTGAPGLAAHKIQQFGWRNYMSTSLFTHLAMRAGFIVTDQITIEWGGIPNLDGLSMLWKPEAH